MKLQNNQYTVQTSVETTPRLDQYDIVHNTEHIDTNDFFMARTFEITRPDGPSLRIALLDLNCANTEPYAILEEHHLLTILSRAILRLDLNSGSIIQYVPCENMGGLMEIFPITDGYLIWGECDIFRYDTNLRQVWNFSGRDTFVSLHANKSFWIDRNHIHCRDFLGWQYILDFDGNLLEEFHEFKA